MANSLPLHFISLFLYFCPYYSSPDVIFVFYFFVVSLIYQNLLKFYYIYNWSWGELTSFQHFLFLSRWCSVAQSCLTLCSLHGLQPARLPCSSLSPGVCSISCPLSQWCHQPLHPLSPAFLLPLIFPSIRVFSSQSTLHVRWPEHWSFSICPSSVYSGLISFRIDWFDLLAVQGTLKSLLQHHSPKVSIPQCLPFLMVQLTSVHD